MAGYAVLIEKSALKKLESLTQSLRSRVERRIDGLRTDPKPRGSKHLSGGKINRWRIRQGDIRVIYTIDETRKEVRVITIGSRGDVYKGKLRGKA